MHAEQPIDDALLKVPAAQRLQIVAPDVDEYRPAVHGTQNAELASCANLPAHTRKKMSDKDQHMDDTRSAGDAALV